MLPFVLIGLIGLDLWAMMVGYNRQAWLALGGGVACWGLAMLYDNFSWRRGLLLVLVFGNVAVNFYLQMDRRSIIDKTDAAGHMRVAAEASVADRMRQAVLADPRWEIWRFSLEKIAEHPLVGAGLGRYVFRRTYPEFQSDKADHWHAHNMILNKGIQMGIPGMLAFLFLWLALARELVHHVRTSVVHRNLAVAGLSIAAAIFAKNMTDDFFVRDTALMFWLVMGLLIGVLRSAQSKGIQTEPANAGSLAPKQ
jgi:O-antigen ligase